LPDSRPGRPAPVSPLRPFPLPGKKRLKIGRFLSGADRKIYKTWQFTGAAHAPADQKTKPPPCRKAKRNDNDKKNPHFRDSLIALLFNSSLFIFYVIYVIKRKYK